MNRLILISGGIGAGKSVVCKVLIALGYSVYDCDSNAKSLMDSDPVLCCEIDRALSTYCNQPLVDNNFKLDRGLLSRLVFSKPEALKKLNAIVHPAVLSDILKWRSTQHRLCFVESAIPAESGLRKIVDEEWIVEAPEELRIKRVGERNGLSEDSIKRRINAQKSEWVQTHPSSHIITNDGHHSILLRVHELLDTEV